MRLTWVGTYEVRCRALDSSRGTQPATSQRRGRLSDVCYWTTEHTLPHQTTLL